MAEENGIREAVQNLKENVKELFTQVHNIEINGCVHKKAHEENYRAFYALYNENRRDVEKRQSEMRKDIQELKMAGVKTGVYVGIIVAIIGMLAQALIRIVL